MISNKYHARVALRKIEEYVTDMTVFHIKNYRKDIEMCTCSQNRTLGLRINIG